MRCTTVRNLLDDHADGILPADRSSQVRAHLDACADCEQEYELLRSVTAPLAAWGDLEPPAGCFDRILERIEALPPEMHVPASQPAGPSLRFLRGGARWLVTSGAAAAAVLFAAVAVERAGDIDSSRPARDRANVQLTRAVTGLGPGLTALKPGEIPLTRFSITEDLEQRDGLRRRRADRESGPEPLRAVPVGHDPLGNGPR